MTKDKIKKMLTPFLNASITKKQDEWIKAEIETIVYDMLEEQEKENKRTLERWLALLETDGIDSKNMVATDIQKLLEELNVKSNN